MELREFLRKATKRERYDVAVVCNDSVNYLYQLAGKHRYASPHMATLIEHSTREVAKTSNGRLEAVPRASMVKHPEIFFGPIESLWKRLGLNDDSEEENKSSDI